MIVLPIDADGLESKTELGVMRYLKVPSAAILDLFAWRWRQTIFTTCRHIVDPAINVDVAEGGIGPDPFLISRNRRVLYTRADGRKILLRTKSSRTDFVDGPRTPGTIP